MLFPLRQRIPSFRRHRYEERASTEMAQDFVPAEIAQRLADSTLRMGLYYAWILDQLPWRGPRDHQRVIDLGSKNFFYAPVLNEWLQKRNGRTNLIGLEADPARLYRDLYRREDYAHYYVDLINRHYPLGPYVFYQAGNWLDRPKAQYDLITSFFPFIYDDLSDAWGLPRRYFVPKDFYQKCAEESSWVLFFHQGDEEREDSKKIMESLGRGHLHFEQKFGDNPYLERRHPTWALLWKTDS